MSIPPKEDYFAKTKIEDLDVTIGEFNNKEQINVCGKNNKTLWVGTPPLKALKPIMSMEGNLGGIGYQGKIILERPDAKFKIGLGFGGLGPKSTFKPEDLEKCPGVDDAQREFFCWLRAAHKQVFTKIFEKRPETFTSKIDGAIDGAVKTRLGWHKGNKTPGIETSADLYALMDTDPSEKELILKDALETFLGDTTIRFPDVELGEDGRLKKAKPEFKVKTKKTADDKPNFEVAHPEDRCATWVESSVWTRDTLGKIPDDHKFPTLKQLDSTVENFLQIVTDMQPYYKYNGPRFFDDEGVSLRKSEKYADLPYRTKYELPSNKKHFFKGQEITGFPNPMFDPFKNASALVMTKMMLRVSYSEKGGMTLFVVPDGNYYIMRREEYSGGSKSVDFMFDDAPVAGTKRDTGFNPEDPFA